MHRTILGAETRADHEPERRRKPPPLSCQRESARRDCALFRRHAQDAAIYERPRFAFERVRLGGMPIAPQAPDMPRPLRYRQAISTDGTQSAATPSPSALCGVVRRQRLPGLRGQEAIKNARNHVGHAVNIHFKFLCVVTNLSAGAYFLPICCALSQSSIIFLVSDVVVRPSAFAILSSEFLMAGVSLRLTVIVFGGRLGDFICFHFRLSAL
jgi:hypothetical protein